MNSLKYNYRYAWGNNQVRKKYKGQLCKVLAYGSKNSVLIEFKNGDRLLTSRFAIRIITDSERKEILDKEKTVNAFFEEA